MKVVFMGTPDFSVSALSALAKEHAISLVVTQPDRARGRGKKVIPSPVKKKAVELDIPVFQPNRLRDPDAIARVEAESADVIVVVAFGQLLPKEILNAPKYGCINIHASLLPKYRGAAPIHRAIQAGETESGVTIMQMDEGLDTGDIMAIEKIKISESMTTGQLHDDLSDLGAKMIVKVLNAIENNEIQTMPQNDQHATYAQKISKSEAEIDWQMEASCIHNTIRALDPFPGAWTTCGSMKVKCFSTACAETESQGTPGEILEVNPKGFRVQAGKGSLWVREVQVPGKRRMPVSDFLRGNKLEKGVVLLSKENLQEK